jgi:hypothetical protein
MHNTAYSALCRSTANKNVRSSKDTATFFMSFMQFSVQVLYLFRQANPVAYYYQHIIFDISLDDAMKLGSYTGAKMMVPPAVSFLAKQIMTASPLAAKLPSMISQAAPAAVSALAVRGGEAALQGFDLGRTQIRLQSISSYGVIAALLLNAALRLYSSTPKKLEKGQTIENYAKIVFALSVGLSTICGTYTTVVFSLLGLYSKSALGLGKDAAFLAFFDATTHIRQRAFNSFIIALLSFEVCFISSLFLNYDGKVRWWATGFASVGAIVSWLQWQNIMSIAGNLLFKN